jgi:hypothetical protein
VVIISKTEVVFFVVELREWMVVKSVRTQATVLNARVGITFQLTSAFCANLKFPVAFIVMIHQSASHAIPVTIRIV